MAEFARLSRMAAVERCLSERGYRWIAGVDEVGRGCLAGPVVAAAVILPPDFRWPGIDDSKQLDDEQRRRLARVVRREAVAYWVASASAVEIDAGNIAKACHSAMRRALAGLDPHPQIVLVDGYAIERCAYPQVPLVKGDARSISIAAASIVAKVCRDDLMLRLSRAYPAYAFDRHKGYGVTEHREALARFGPCPEHRLTFRGVVPGAGGL
jgi:ribonuclease HII